MQGWQEWFVVYVGWGDETHIAKVFAPDMETARVRGFALIENPDDPREDEVDFDNLPDEVVTAIPVTELVVSGD